MSMTVFVTLVIWSCLLYWLENKKLEKNDIERTSERRERAKICVLLRRKNVLHTDQKLEKSYNKLLRASKLCVCVCVWNMRFFSYGWGSGARLRAPGRGPRGQSPRKLSSFQQIRAFKTVVRSDRNCNFSSCNFAYRALVGGRGCGSHQIFRSSWYLIVYMAFFSLFFLQYVPENICNWLQASEPKFSYFALKTCDC